MSEFVIVGLVDPPTRIAICASLGDAEKLVGTLPDAEDGRYYIDVCTEPVMLVDIQKLQG